MPPFKHGCDPQGSKSCSQLCPWNLEGQSHLNPVPAPLDVGVESRSSEQDPPFRQGWLRQASTTWRILSHENDTLRDQSR